ncbi:MAG: 30S ribosomal protein S6 [Planctomycetota bacterium]
METAVKKLYEAMFLVDSALASDWDAVVKTIETVLKRSDAEMASIRNWAERKLAYEIDHKSRATYVLCFFRADGSAIRKIENDVQLSEQILRVLILSTEAREEKDIEKDMHGTPEEKPLDLEETKKDKETPQEADEGEDTASSEQPEEDEFPQSAVPDILDTIEPQQPPETEPVDTAEQPQPPEIEPADAVEPQQPPEIEPTGTVEPQPPLEPGPAEDIEPQPLETEQDEKEKDTAD